MGAFGTTDEFEVVATGDDMPIKRWTRTRLEPCQFIAQRAVEDLGYSKAEVFNTYGGDRSDALYTVTPEQVINQLELANGNQPQVG